MAPMATAVALVYNKSAITPPFFKVVRIIRKRIIPPR